MVVAGPSSRANSDVVGQTTTLVRSVYISVWLAFYDWEREYSRRSIQGLATCSPHHTASNLSRVKSTTVGDSLSDSNHGSDEKTEYFHIVDYDRAKWPRKLHPDTINVPSSSMSRLSYESCTPTSRNIMTGDDSSNLPFIPHADDPRFEMEEHLCQYKTFFWQKSIRDPDCKSA